MDEVLKRFSEIEERLRAVESRLDLQGQVSAQTPVSSNSGGAPLPPPYVPETVAPFLQTGDMPSAPAVATQNMDTGRIESYIGRKLLGLVGVIAVLFGSAFFLKYAFESNLIGPIGRVAIEVLAGLGFIVVGEWLRARLPRYADFITGLGLALLYLAVYGSFHWYHLIGQFGALAFMSAVSAFGMAFAVWASAPSVAILASVGAFATPFLLATNEENDFGLFAYIGIVNLGILAVSFFRKWQHLILVGFIGTVLIFASWWGFSYTPEKLWFAAFVLTAFYLIYTVAGVVENFTPKERANTADLFILTAVPLWYFGWMYALLWADHRPFLGFIAAAIGALYILFAYLASRIRADDRRLTLFLGAIAVVFLTIAIPLELEQNAITIAWGVEAAVLFVLGVVLRNSGMRMFATAVFALTAVRLLVFDSGAGDLGEFIPLFNKRFFTYFMTIVAGAVMGYAAVRGSRNFIPAERGTTAFLWSSVNLLMILAITLEIYAFFDARIFAVEDRLARQQAKEIPLDYGSGSYYPSPWSIPVNGEYRSLVNQRNAAISVFWTLYAIVLITFGIAFRTAFLRWSALAVFGVTALKVFLIDLSQLETIYRIISFIVLGILLLAASYLYFRFEKRLDAPRQP